MAREVYFFWVCLIASILRIPAAFFFILEDFHHLAVSHIRPPDHPEEGKDGHEYTPGAQPLIEMQTDEKTKNDAAGHRQPQLHYNGQVFSPCTVLFVIETHPERFLRMAGRLLPISTQKIFDSTPGKKSNWLFRIKA
jgi:hypothetical protein